METDTENGAAWPEAKELRGTVRGRKDTPSPAAPRTPDSGLLRSRLGEDFLLF